jgi:predicted transposase YbfD/YdcC
MGTQKPIAKHIVDDDGEYVLALKGNHGTLAKEVQETFALAQADHFAHLQHQFYQTVDKGHGRLEIRKHWMIDDPEYITYLDPKGAWKGLRSIGMIQSERRIGEQVSQETRSYLLSFSRKVEVFARAVRSRLRH